MRLYIFTLLSICVVAIFYHCISSSSMRTHYGAAISSFNGQRAKIKQYNSVRPLLIADYSYNNNSDANGTIILAEIDSDGTSFIQNKQGSIHHRKLRYDLGPLPHKHIATKSLESIDNCNMESNLIKHVIPSAASSLTWEDDDQKGAGSKWQIINDRGDQNAKDMFQSIIITDYTADGDDSIDQIIKVDQIVVDVSSINDDGNEDATKVGRWQAQDQRVIQLHNNYNRIIIYHSKVQRSMWLYNHATHKTVMLTICGHGLAMEKNWSPIVVNDDIVLFMYSIDPLVLLSYNVNVGDGVCKLVFGHLPLIEGMDAPYGGTPFVELSFPTDNESNTRSFLSIAHSRKGNDLISEDRRNNQRIYRPVPVVLHIFCNSDEKGDEQSSLIGCTFAIDVYDLWHEVESPEELLHTKWKQHSRSQQMRSVSFPYDLYVFQDNGIIRVGIEYEDCYCVYEDYEINFDTFRDRQIEHRMRLELEKEDINKEAGLLPKQVTSRSSLECSPTYSHTEEDKNQVTPFATEIDLAKAIDDKIWIVSHQYNRNTDVKEDSLDSVLRNYPNPIQKLDRKDNLRAPKLCVYIYGSVYQSILSELKENGNLDTTKILHNNKHYPTFSTLEELLLHPDDDPMGIRNQFEQFLAADNLVYPIILIRDDIFDNADAMKKLDSLVSQMVDDVEYDIISVLTDKGYEKPTSSSLGSIENVELQKQFISRYADLNDMFEKQPLIRILMPTDDN